MKATVYYRLFPSRWKGPAARDLWLVSVIINLPGNEELGVEPRHDEVLRWSSLRRLASDIPAQVGQVLFEHMLEQYREITRLEAIEKEATAVMDVVTHGFREDIDFRPLRAALGDTDEEVVNGPDGG